MTVLVDWQIQEERKCGNIVIEPFDVRQLKTVSYDVRLGEWFFRQNKKNFSPESLLIDPWSESDVLNMWGEPLCASEAYKVCTERELERKRSFGIHDRVIIVNPLETVLAHTIEFIGGKNCITTQMHARSSAGRMSIEVCKCAGWGDVGYVNRWTMEITNNSYDYRLVLPTGRRIAQIVFINVDTPRFPDYSIDGKYQRTDELSELMKNWSPTDMLPKLWLDWELR